MKYGRLLLIALALAFAGCASNPMTVSESQTVSKVNPDDSQVVFMRSSFVGSAISASLYEIDNNEPKFIGVLGNGTKVAHTTTPGKHVFMVVSEAADFMEAELLPGKTYYSIVTPRLGLWKARFSMWPIRSDGSGEYNTGTDQFNEWIAETKLVENSDASRAWFESNAPSVRKKQAEYWPVWQQKSTEDIAVRTLRPNDGS